MIIIGLLLLVVAVVFGVDLIFNNSHHIASPAVFGNSLGIHNEATLFVVGAVTGAVVLFGVVLILEGTRHKGAKAFRRHQERKDAKGTRGERDDLLSDNEHLRTELAQQRTAEPPVTPTVVVERPVEVVERPVEVVDQPPRRAGATRSSGR